MFFRGFRARSLGLSLAGVLLAGSVQLSAGERTTAPSFSMTMSPLSLATGATAREPMGWTDFCKRHQSECETQDPPKGSLLQKASLTAVGEIAFDDAAREIVARINSAVNAEITPATDREMWGVEERWDFPIAGRGDCEDYVLLKRARLMAAGFPRRALLITVVTDLQGEGHAVLTLKTDRGDYILDNMNDHVILWRETPYGFVKRQSQVDQNVWVSLGGVQMSPSVANPPVPNPVLVSR